jgi:S1-C subfamily serine protease
MRPSKRLVLVSLLLLLPLSFAAAQLREYVAIIRPQFHQTTRQQFAAWADYFARQGDSYWAQFFRWYAGQSTGHGTGWVVDQNGENFIITNRHVVKQAETVDIIFELEDGSTKTFEDCPIVYVDDYMDLAVLQFPGGRRVYRQGLSILPRRQPDGTEIVAAGFPGFGSQPLWQYSSGIVSNSAARIDPNYDYLIQHTAPIDPGNSGGPLMIRDSAAPLGYRVVGVNTSKAINRENTNFSIPAEYVLQVLDKAREALAIQRSPERLQSELERSARILAAELASEKPDQERLGRLISYAFVGERGLESYSEVVSLVPNPEEWDKSFQDDPIETMRNAVQIRFWLELASRGNLASIAFSAINPADRDEIVRKSSIRTTFDISGTPTEIVWTREYGHWRVKNMEMAPLPSPEPLPEPSGGVGPGPGPSVESSSEEPTPEAVRAWRQQWAFGFRGGVGSSSSEGDVYYYSEFQSQWGATSWYAGLVAERGFANLLWLEAGIGVSHMGHGYYFSSPPDNISLDRDEAITYLQIPAMVKLGIVGTWFAVFFGGGPAIDLAVVSGGSYDDKFTGTSGRLTSDDYSGYLNPFNISLCAVAAFEFGLYKNYNLGLELTADYHLLNDFDWGVPESAHFLSVGGGVYFRWIP